jgi:hypothetical protein
VYGFDDLEVGFCGRLLQDLPSVNLLTYEWWLERMCWMVLFDSKLKFISISLVAHYEIPFMQSS